MEPKFEQPLAKKFGEISTGYYIKIAVYGGFSALMFFMAATSTKEFWPAGVGAIIMGLLAIYLLYVTARQISGNEKHIPKNKKNEPLHKGVLFLLLAPVSFFVTIITVELNPIPISSVFLIIGFYNIIIYYFFNQNVTSKTKVISTVAAVLITAFSWIVYLSLFRVSIW